MMLRLCLLASAIALAAAQGAHCSCGHASTSPQSAVTMAAERYSDFSLQFRVGWYDSRSVLSFCISRDE
jgi:uncharacterized protein YcfL